MPLFPNAQFYIQYCQYPLFRQRRSGGGMGFTMDDLIAKRLYAYAGGTSETICLEVTISKKWCVTFRYSVTYNSNKDSFFEGPKKFLSNISRKYENVLVVGDLNIDILDQNRVRKITYLIYVILSRSQILYQELHA